MRENFTGIDMVGDGGNGFILNVGGAAEAFDNTGGYGGKGVVVFELTLEKVPQHAVFWLVGALDLHIIVNPHHPFLSVGLNSAHSALVAVAAEIHGHIVCFSAGDVAARASSQGQNTAGGNKTA